MRHEESRMQMSCVRWFDYQYPEYSKLLFAVPNGGARSKIEAGILKAEGVRSGVADLILLIARHGYNALCLEAKTKKGTPSPDQKDWSKQAENAGNKYVIFRSLEEFMEIINDYLK